MPADPKPGFILVGSWQHRTLPHCPWMEFNAERDGFTAGGQTESRAELQNGPLQGAGSPSTAVKTQECVPLECLLGTPPPRPL